MIALCQRHMLYEAGRDNRVDNGIFIHAIVARHVESVVLMSRAGTETTN